MGTLVYKLGSLNWGLLVSGELNRAIIKCMHLLRWIYRILEAGEFIVEFSFDLGTGPVGNGLLETMDVVIATLVLALISYIYIYIYIYISSTKKL